MQDFHMTYFVYIHFRQLHPLSDQVTEEDCQPSFLLTTSSLRLAYTIPHPFSFPLRTRSSNVYLTAPSNDRRSRSSSANQLLGNLCRGRHSVEEIVGRGCLSLGRFGKASYENRLYPWALQASWPYGLGIVRDQQFGGWDGVVVGSSVVMPSLHVDFSKCEANDAKLILWYQ